MKNLSYFLALVLSLSACNRLSPLPERDFAEDMRQFVQTISSNAKAQDPNFIVIPQNGQELLTTNLQGDGPLATDYIAAIDGQGREALFFGYDRDNQATPEEETSYIVEYLDRAKEAGITILVTDYCSSEFKITDSYSLNSAKGYTSFVADERELNQIPRFPERARFENNNWIHDLNIIFNFLYLINPSEYPAKDTYIEALSATNYDVLIIDAFYNGALLSQADVSALQLKANGSPRLVIAYMSIGEAEDYRYYWKEDWEKKRPDWLDNENPQWRGNYKVRYWEPDWQSIIVGTPDSYLQNIIDAGFNGVYLDIIDAFEYFSE